MRRMITAALLLASAACSDRFEPEYVADLRLVPDSTHMSAAQTQVFAAVPVSQFGNELPDRAARVRWSFDGGDAATMEPSGDQVTVTATELGAARLTAALGRGSSTAFVFVQPPGLARIEIAGSSFDASIGQWARFEARLLDAQGAELSTDGFRISWKIHEPSVLRTIYTSYPTLSCWGLRPGQSEITLVVGHLSIRRTVTVR